MTKQIPKPCQTCGQPTTQTRCEQCNRTHTKQNPRKTNRTHYKGDYRRRAKQVVDAATICWICKEGWRSNDPFTADHIYPGQPDSPLAPAHRSCNSRKRDRYIPPEHL